MSPSGAEAEDKRPACKGRTAACVTDPKLAPGASYPSPAWRNLTPEVVRIHLWAPFSNTAGLARRNIFARIGPMTDLICLVIPYP